MVSRCDADTWAANIAPTPTRLQISACIFAAHVQHEYGNLPVPCCWQQQCPRADSNKTLKTLIVRACIIWEPATCRLLLTVSPMHRWWVSNTQYSSARTALAFLVTHRHSVNIPTNHHLTLSATPNNEGFLAAAAAAAHSNNLSGNPFKLIGSMVALTEFNNPSD